MSPRMCLDHVPPMRTFRPCDLLDVRTPRCEAREHRGHLASTRVCGGPLRSDSASCQPVQVIPTPRTTSAYVSRLVWVHGVSSGSRLGGILDRGDMRNVYIGHLGRGSEASRSILHLPPKSQIPHVNRKWTGSVRSKPYCGHLADCPEGEERLGQSSDGARPVWRLQ